MSAEEQREPISGVAQMARELRAAVENGGLAASDGERKAGDERDDLAALSTVYLEECIEEMLHWTEALPDLPTLVEGEQNWAANVKAKIWEGFFHGLGRLRELEHSWKNFGYYLGREAVLIYKGRDLLMEVEKELGALESLVEQRAALNDDGRRRRLELEAVYKEWFGKVCDWAVKAWATLVAIEDGVVRLPLCDKVSYFESFARGWKSGLADKRWQDRRITGSEIDIFLVLHSPLVEAFDSVRQFHGWLKATFGDKKVLNLKRTEKWCQRNGLRFRSRGRPPGSG